MSSLERSSSLSVAIDGDTDLREENVMLDLGSTNKLFDVATPSPVAPAPSASAPATVETPEISSRPGTESIAYIKRLISPALHTLRDIQLTDKINTLAGYLEECPDGLRKELESRDQAKRLQREEQREQEKKIEIQSEQLARQLRDEDEENECIRLKNEAGIAFKRIGERYDTLVEFVSTKPQGTYEDFVEFLLLAATSNNMVDESETYKYNDLMFENFYSQESEHRKLWNDNLTLGLDHNSTTLDGRTFVPARDSSPQKNSAESKCFDNFDPWQSFDESLNENVTGAQSPPPHERLLSRERIKQLSNLDRHKVASSAFNVISSVSSLALKPLRDLQLAEKVNAMQLDIEEEEAQREIKRYHRIQEDKRDFDDMMKVKKEAEERTIALTKDHLLTFLLEHPNATYHEWIEDLHPENAHEGTLLEGLGKTVDHRFFVEESDHRRLWNDNLTTFVSDGSQERLYVPPRARQMDEDGNMVAFADLLSGSEHVVECSSRAEDSSRHENNESSTMNNADLIAFN